MADRADSGRSGSATAERVRSVYRWGAPFHDAYRIVWSWLTRPIERELDDLFEVVAILHRRDSAASDLVPGDTNSASVFVVVPEPDAESGSRPPALRRRRTDAPGAAARASNARSRRADALRIRSLPVEEIGASVSAAPNA